MELGRHVAMESCPFAKAFGTDPNPQSARAHETALENLVSPWLPESALDARLHLLQASHQVHRLESALHFN